MGNDLFRTQKVGFSQELRESCGELSGNSETLGFLDRLPEIRNRLHNIPKIEPGHPLEDGDSDSDLRTEVWFN
jgi:hypothetical protein